MELSPLQEERFSITDREELYQNRLKTAYSNLLADMNDWIKNLEELEKLKSIEGAEQKKPTTVIYHHITQMKRFCEFIYSCFITQKRGEAVNDNPLTVEALVIAIITSQWLLMRQVVHQHFPGLPYEEKLQNLDQFAAKRYFAMFKALPEAVQNKMSIHPPLVHLGASSALSLVEGGLSIVNVPFGVVFDDQIQYAISHELGHIFINDNLQILDEIKTQVKSELEGTKQEKIIQKKIMGWLEEILADLIGVAMDGVAFANSGIWVMSSAESRIGITDKEHPESTIRPYIYEIAIEALEDQLLAMFGSAAMKANGDTDIQTKIKELRQKDLAYLRQELEKIKAERKEAKSAEGETAAMSRPGSTSNNDPLTDYYQKKVSFLGKLRDASGGEKLNKTLQSDENLFFPMLDDVRVQMENIIKKILTATPQTLMENGQADSVQEFLHKIFDNVQNPVSWYDNDGYEMDVSKALGGLQVENFVARFNWGDKPLDECGDLILSLPASLNLEHGTPSLYDDIYYICCRMNLGFCC